MASGEIAFWVKKALGLAILPPASLLLALVAIVLGLLAVRRARPARWLRAMLLGCVAALWLSATPWFANLAMRQVEADAGSAVDEAQARAFSTATNGPQAIVVLGGGLRRDSRERPDPVALHPRTATRLTAAIRLARWSGLPMLVSGGSPLAAGPSEAEVMARVARRDFDLAPRWVETQSRDTAENARLSAGILRRDGIERVLLVTEGYHMRRSLREFEAAGLRAIPAPVGFQGSVGYARPFALLPSGEAAYRTWLAVHEILGGIWYRVAAR